MENDIRILRLVTGEDIICNFNKISVDDYVVSDPMTLIIKFSGKNSNVIMEHWLPVEVIHKNSVLIESKQVLTMFDPNEDLAEYYTGLVEKLHDTIRQRRMVEEMELDGMVELIEAVEESKSKTIH